MQQHQLVQVQQAQRQAAGLLVLLAVMVGARVVTCPVALVRQGPVAMRVLGCWRLAMCWWMASRVRWC